MQNNLFLLFFTSLCFLINSLAAKISYKTTSYGKFLTMILDFDFLVWTWSCVGQKSLKFKVIVKINQKWLINSRTQNQGKTEKNTCTFIYYDIILLFIMK